MSLSSPLFLLTIFPIVLILSFVLPAKFKAAFLLVLSLLMYMWSGVYGFIIIFLLALATYWFGRLTAGSSSTRRKKGWTALGILANLALLSVLKYSAFAIQVLQNIGMNFPTPMFLFLDNLIIPLGVSFVVFQCISYLVETYRGNIQPRGNFFYYILYLFFFPTVTSGPIARFPAMLPQYKAWSISMQDLHDGLRRFCMGLAKKVLIADTIGAMYASVDYTRGTAFAWASAIFFTLQIYFDFSGYSDMSIGIGKALGLTLPENFQYPYTAKGIGAFWRQWHMSLSSWFRDYLYIPLGGSRTGRWRTIFNLFIVFLCTGIWHGANWTFVAWGLYQWVFIALERLGLKKLLDRIPQGFTHLYTMLVVVVGWVIFSSRTLWDAGQHIALLFSFNFECSYALLPVFTSANLFFLLLAICLSSPWTKNAYGRLKTHFAVTRSWVLLVEDVFVLGLFCVTFVFLVSGTVNPFIYERF